MTREAPSAKWVRIALGNELARQRTSGAALPAERIRRGHAAAIRA